MTYIMKYSTFTYTLNAIGCNIRNDNIYVLLLSNTVYQEIVDVGIAGSETIKNIKSKSMIIDTNCIL